MEPFTIIEPDEALAVRKSGPRGRHPSRLSLALEAGEVALLTGGDVISKVTALRARSSYLSARGFRVRQRTTSRGTYVWAERGQA